MADLHQIDQVVKLADRQIWVVTAATEDRRGGLVATWVTTNSIDRQHPTMMIALAANHFTAELVDASQSFGLHLFTADHLSTVWNFALGSGRDRDKLAQLRTKTAATGAPILEQCAGWLDCRVTARLAAADRVYYWADIEAGQVAEDSPATILTESKLIEQSTPEQRVALKENLSQDVRVQRPMINHWRENLPDYLQP